MFFHKFGGGFGLDASGLVDLGFGLEGVGFRVKEF